MTGNAGSAGRLWQCLGEGGVGLGFVRVAERKRGGASQSSDDEEI